MKPMPLGFIGVGIMGEGMVSKILASGREVFVVKHKNPEPIERVKGKGAQEILDINGLAEKCEIILLCLPNSKTVKKVFAKLAPKLPINSLIIDCTTNNLNTVLEIGSLAKSKKLRYIEAPLTGGYQQSVSGKLGAMVGGGTQDYILAKQVLKPCCQKIERIGALGMGARAKLISNFLALGTASLAIESLRVAKQLGVDWKKFYGLASLGSGSSKSLDRMAPKAIKDDYNSYAFTIDNAIKDFQYMLELFKNNKRLTDIIKPILKTYKEDKEILTGNHFISSRLSKEFLADINQVK